MMPPSFRALEDEDAFYRSSLKIFAALDASWSEALPADLPALVYAHETAR